MTHTGGLLSPQLRLETRTPSSEKPGFVAGGGWGLDSLCSELSEKGSARSAAAHSCLAGSRFAGQALARCRCTPVCSLGFRAGAGGVRALLPGSAAHFGLLEPSAGPCGWTCVDRRDHTERSCALEPPKSQRRHSVQQQTQATAAGCFGCFRPVSM